MNMNVVLEVRWLPLCQPYISFRIFSRSRYISKNKFVRSPFNFYSDLGTYLNQFIVPAHDDNMANSQLHLTLCLRISFQLYHQFYTQHKYFH